MIPIIFEKLHFFRYLTRSLQDLGELGEQWKIHEELVYQLI